MVIRKRLFLEFSGLSILVHGRSDCQTEVTSFAMALQVIGAGFGRTGTNSLKLALQELGFSKCHHMREVMGNRKQVEAWHALSRGEKVDWDRVFEGYGASCDWPSSAYWEELYQYYPESKVILSARDEERWYGSVIGTIYQVSAAVPKWMMLVIPHVRMVKEMIDTTIWNGIFGGRFEDKAHAIQIYRENAERVKRVVAPDRLLICEAKDGWEPLCAFLNVPVPETPYPHVNEAAEMKRNLKMLRALRWVPHVLLAAVVAAYIL